MVKFARVTHSISVVLCMSTTYVARFEPLCLFLIYRPTAVYEHWIFFQCTYRADS